MTFETPWSCRSTWIAGASPPASLTDEPRCGHLCPAGDTNDAAPWKEPHHWARSGSPLRGDGCGCQGEELASGVGDLDLAGLGLLGYRDGCREDPVLVGSGDVLTVQALP